MNSNVKHSSSRRACRGWVAKTSLVIFFLAYVSLGAYVFMLIETSSSQQQSVAHHHTPPTEEIRTALSGTVEPGGPKGNPSEEVTQMQELMTRQVLDRLWDITENLNILYKENWTRLASDEISRFHESMYVWMKKDCNRRKSQEMVTHPLKAPAIHQTAATAKWNYATALLYSLSVITTLGSCPVIPSSNEGKFLTVLYASFGIPLLLFYLTVVGSALSSCMQCCLLDWRGRRNMQSHQQAHSTSGKSPSIVTTRLDPSCQPNELFHHPIKAIIKDDESIEGSSTSSMTRERIRSYWPPVFCLLLILVYIASGTWFFSSFMSLPVMDALLLSFMLFTTMGIPDAHSAIWTSANGPVVAVSIYIFLGLTLCSFCLNLLYDWLLTRWASSAVPYDPSAQSDRRLSRS